MAQEAVITVRSELSKIVEDLNKISKTAQMLSSTMQKGNEDVGKAVQDSTTATEKGLNKMRDVGRRVFDQLKSDLKTLAGVNALASGLRLNESFRGSIKDTVNLADNIRKIGGTLGIAKDRFTQFHQSMTKGLGDIGVGSQAASRALEGLATTSVRGEENVMGYAKSSSMLASISRDKGGEGRIAQGLAGTLQARGMNPNDAAARQALEKEVTKAVQATGKSASEILKSMQGMYESMDKGMRAKVGFHGMAQMASVATAGGPGATKAIEEYLKMSKIERMGMEAQGAGRLIGGNGQIDMKALQNFVKTVGSRIGGDPRKSLETAGFSSEAAEGLVRLAQNGDQAALNLKQLEEASDDMYQVFKDGRTIGEAWNASLDRVKSKVSGVISPALEALHKGLNAVAGSDVGAGLAVGGAGLLSAILMGGGMRAIGGGMLGSLAKGQAASAITGKEVQPVYVVNASEIGGMGAAGGLMKGAGGAMGKAGMFGIAAAGGIAAGTALNKGINYLAENTEAGKKADNYLQDKFNQLITALGILPEIVKSRKSEVSVNLMHKDLKATTMPGRGMNQ